VRIGELWSGFVAESPRLSERLCEARIPEVWQQLLGTPVMSLTRSLEIKSGILHVSMTSSVARQEIFMRREDIRHRLNTALGMLIIRSIIVR
jgi:hypothetical protein